MRHAYAPTSMVLNYPDGSDTVKDFESLGAAIDYLSLHRGWSSYMLMGLNPDNFNNRKEQSCVVLSK